MGKNEANRRAVKSCDASDENLVSPGEGKGNKLWKKVKYQLVEYHALPGYLKDNEYILAHYRAEWPLKQAFLSIFSIHNETLNVWTCEDDLVIPEIVDVANLVPYGIGSLIMEKYVAIRHLLGFFLFLSLTIYTAMKVPNVVDLNLPSALRNADFQKLHADLITCLPSLLHMPDLHKLREELKTSLPSMNLSPYLSNWHIMDLLSNCLPENLTYSNHIDTCVLVLHLPSMVVFS
ncbi:hypothetical protein SASPL_146741 [Salvia splendens]|uniref:Uncharacterized protein n=1 Tax=Salvia splendens TaxID=180675 RepID=A0A8X8Z626_SALSN|nr:hypothetical protein SASPL_146741 [Salvia splendens]